MDYYGYDSEIRTTSIFREQKYMRDLEYNMIPFCPGSNEWPLELVVYLRGWLQLHLRALQRNECHKLLIDCPRELCRRNTELVVEQVLGNVNYKVDGGLHIRQQTAPFRTINKTNAMLITIN